MIGRRLCEGIGVYFHPSDNNTPNKLMKLKENALKELESDPSLLKMGH